MPKINAGPRLASHPRHGMGLPQSRQARGNRADARALVGLVILATVAVVAPAIGQTGKPAATTTGDSCSGVMEHLNEARATAPGQYTKVLMSADNRCLGVTERADKARMITRDEYVKAFGREPDCSAAVYSYMCE